jgi:predicted nuclease of predicted toxin-antitoxin system
MKFKIDENLGDLGRDLFEAAGHEVSTVVQQQMSGANDVALYETCRAAGRVLVTLDRDFGEGLRFPPEDTAGIAILDCRGRFSPHAILARIKDLKTLPSGAP